MSDFARWVCWQPEVVASVIATEAISSSDAVFRATHAPLRIRRQSRSTRPGAVTARVLSEAELLKEFLGAPPNEGVLVAPVLGESGSGKSHLVRWVYTQTPETDERRVIYLPKTHTSLRDVVTILLQDQQGPEFDRIRAQVARLGDSVNEANLQHRILNSLAEVLRNATTTDPFAKPLVGDNGLAALLHDPLFREYMLRSGAFIQRRADHAMNGRGDEDVPLEFTVDDLPLDIENVARLKDAARATQTIFRQLASNPRIQQAAVQLLNDNLDVAVMQAASLGVGDVKKAFLDLRAELVGKEIILLVEDFALIQGVQRDLLDAIVEAGVVKGQQKYAVVRTLMAVTTGYYRQLDETFRTRAEASSPIYELDMHLSGDGGVSQQEAVDFVARYLNVARTGEDDIERNGVVTNACDECAFRDTCHSGFGSSADGYGLYPYNDAAILAVVESAASDQHPDRFSPRSVLARAVRQMLMEQAREIEEGTFPGPSFSDILPIRPHMNDLEIPDARVLERLFEGDELARHRNLLVFWGGARGLVNLDRIVNTAFSIDPLPEGISQSPRNESVDKTKPARHAVEAVVPQSVSRGQDEIAAWLKGQNMPQGVASTIRGILLDAIEARCRFAAPPMKAEGRLAEFFKNARSKGALYVSIEGARENLPGAQPPPIRFSRSASNAEFFQHLLAANKAVYSDTRESLARLETIAEKQYRTFERLAVERTEFDESHLIGAIRSQLLGAALAGKFTDPNDAASLLDTVFWDGSGETRADWMSRVDRWSNLEEAYLKERQEVAKCLSEALGVSQGAGGVHAIDVPRTVELARRALKSQNEFEVPSWAERAESSRARLEALVPDQLASWQALVASIRERVPVGVSFQDTVDSLESAATAGAPHGLVVVQDVREVTQRNAAAKSFDFNTVIALERLLGDTTTSTDRGLLTLVGQDTGTDPARIAQYLTWSEQWVERGITRGEPTDASDQNLDAKIQSVVQQWLDVVRERNDVA